MRRGPGRTGEQGLPPARRSPGQLRRARRLRGGLGFDLRVRASRCDGEVAGPGAACRDGLAERGQLARRLVDPGANDRAALAWQRAGCAPVRWGRAVAWSGGAVTSAMTLLQVLFWCLH